VIAFYFVLPLVQHLCAKEVQFKCGASSVHCNVAEICIGYQFDVANAHQFIAKVFEPVFYPRVAKQVASIVLVVKGRAG
jgi:hypothetical protein